MAYSTLTLDVADRVATIATNRPDKLNALSDQLITSSDRRWTRWPGATTWPA
jgi:enoyl-CoA hydratase/carnithine racemase